MSEFYKVEDNLFGVQKVKQKFPYRLCVLYFDNEREAWEHLKTRTLSDIHKAKKALDKSNRDYAKALKKLQSL